MKATIEDLSTRARQAIEAREQFVCDVASESCQMVDNVARMRWFRLAVMRTLATTTRKYKHILKHIPDV